MTKSTLLIILLIMSTTSFNAFTQDSENTSTAGLVPDRIMLSIPGEPATTRAVTWRTATGAEQTIGQITVATASPFFEDQLQTVEGQSSWWEENNKNSLGHKVLFKNLKPETLYSYRVGDGENWSEWFQFKTSSAHKEPFNFIYLGDFQNDIKAYCSRTIRQAYSHFPNADFILYAGDLVSRSTESYWSEFFHAGNWIYGMLPSVATPGNHEYYKEDSDKPRTFSRHWNQIFVNPENGPENLENRSYYMDYQGVRFVSLDSPAMGYRNEDRENTINWLDKILAENPNQWAILFTHYPIYSCSQGRNNEEYRKAVKPLLEKYGVDLVLQGHDHSYCRGQNLENVGAVCKNPPMYMVSVSGPKMYGLNVEKWSDRVASQAQLYQNVEVDENKIHVEVYTVTGDLYDEFSLVKSETGKNKVLESGAIKTIKETTAIPERAKEKYSEKELELYNERFTGQN